MANEVVKPLEVRPIFPEDEKNDLLDGVARLLDDVHIAQLGSLNLLLCLLAARRFQHGADVIVGVREGDGLGRLEEVVHDESEVLEVLAMAPPGRDAPQPQAVEEDGGLPPSEFEFLQLT